MATKKVAKNMIEKVNEVCANMRKMSIESFTLPIFSERPLISNAFPQKTLLQILGKHMKRPDAFLPLSAKDPIANFEACIHWTKGEDGNMYPAVPGSSFKASLVAACRMTELEMMTTKQLFHVIPHRIRIYGDQPLMCEHRVRNERGGIDIRHRAMFMRWAAELPIRFYTGGISRDMIIQLAMLGGFGCGIGDWRVAAPKSNNGQMGTWRLAEAGVDGEVTDYTRYCAEDEPFDWDMALEYGIVPLDRVEYYRQVAAAAANSPDPEKPKKKKSKKVDANLEEALRIANGVVPVEGIVAPDGYRPQE
jgi:hypothetical protein